MGAYMLLDERAGRGEAIKKGMKARGAVIPPSS